MPLPAADHALRMRCWELVREFVRDLEDDARYQLNTDDEDTDE